MKRAASAPRIDAFFFTRQVVINRLGTFPAAILETRFTLKSTVDSRLGWIVGHLPTCRYLHPFHMFLREAEVWRTRGMLFPYENSALDSRCKNSMICNNTQVFLIKFRP
jgi:hypothetical protein